MDKIIHDQTKDRHIIYVPMPFTEDGLKYFVAHMNGWEDDPETVQNYVDAIIESKTVDLNPSSSLGEGANIVDIFSFGLKAYAKLHGFPDPDLKELWLHPCLNKLAVIKTIEADFIDIEVNSHEQVMYEAMDRQSGKIVKASDLGNCPYNGDHLEDYESNR